MVTSSPISTEVLTERDPCATGSTVRVRHILLVTRSFPPLNVVSSHRMYQWAKYWSRDGVRVTVLTTRKHGFFGPCDLDLPPLANVGVVEVEFLPALMLRLLARWQPAQRPTGASPGPVGPRSGRSSRLIRAKLWLRRWRLSSKALPAFEFYDLWVAKAARAGARIIASDPVDVVVSSFGPSAAHKIGARLKRRFPHVLWVADYRDVWTFDPNFPLRGLTGYLERRRECESVGRHADLLVHLCNYRAQQSRHYTTKPVIVVENGFDPEESANVCRSLDPIPEAVRAAWAPTTLVYTGILHLDYQDPTPLFQAISLLLREQADTDLCEGLRVLFFGDRHAMLPKLAEDAGVACQVRVVGYVDRPTALAAQRHASALVLIENQQSAARGLLRAKMYEYLQTARPILGIGFDADTEVGRILSETGLGRVCGTDVGRIRESLRSLRVHGAWEGFAPAPEVLRRYRRDVQARRLLGAMDQMLGKEAGRAASWREPPLNPDQVWGN